MSFAEVGQPTMQPIKNRFPTEITLRAAVLHAPPFATVETLPDGTVIYGGFQPDLLRRLQVFAAADNVTLNWNLSVSLPQFGPAMDLVANDCEEVVENATDKCGKLDMIVGNYYATPERALRVDLSPAWLRSTIATVKYVGRTGKDYTTLAEAEEDTATVCLKNGTFYATLVKEKFPNINYFMCPATDECLNELKNETCVLHADDELQLRYKTAWDPTLEMTPETFNTQYIAWPTSFDLDPIVSILLNRWVLKAVTNATLDELYSTYFQKALCPVGTAGEHCELPCDANHGAADSRGVCICHSNKYTGDDCSIEVPEDTNLIPASLLGMAYAMLGINVSVIVGCGLWLIWQRDAAQVRVSQPFFLYLVLLGCLISSMTILPLAQQHEGDGPVHACMAIPWLYSVGFSITFGTLFAKIRRVYLIFKSAVDMRRHIVTFGETLSVIAASLVVDIVVLIVWTVVDPLAWTRVTISEDQFGEPLESVGYCYSDHWMAFAGVIAGLHLLLLATACVMCYVSRSIPTKFSEGKYVSIAMISNLQIFVVGLPILVILGADSQTGFFVRCVIIWMNDLAVVVLIFGNLIYSIHWAPSNGENEQDVKAVVNNAMQQYSRSVRYSRNSIILSSSNLEQSSRSFLPDEMRENGHETISRKLSHETFREEYAQQRIPPTLAEDADTVHTTTASVGTGWQNSGPSRTAKVTKANIPRDVLSDKTSWGGISSSIFEVTDYEDKRRRSSHSQHSKQTVQREDVLSGNKESWAAMNLSTVLHDNPSSSSDLSESSVVEDAAKTDNGLGMPSLDPTSYLCPIAEDSCLGMSSKDAVDKATEIKQAVGNYVSENGTEETSGFSNTEEDDEVKARGSAY